MTKKLLRIKAFIPFFSLFIFCLFNSTIGHTTPFIITPKTGTTLPATVPAGGSTYAYYTIKNNTNIPRYANYVLNLPSNVTQVTDGGFYTDTCGAPFDLTQNGASGDSCTLQLMITGKVSGLPNRPFICVAGSTTLCAGTLTPLNVVSSPAPTFDWVNTNLSGSSYVSDLAVLGDTLFIGGFTTDSKGQLWQHVNGVWTAQYQTPTLNSKVTGLIPTPGTTLYSVVGNAGYGGVDSFLYGGNDPTDITTTALSDDNSSLNDLELGESNALYVAGGTDTFPAVGDVWVYNGTNTWTTTYLKSFDLAPAFWLEFVPSSPTTPVSPAGLYVASYSSLTQSAQPVVYLYSGSPLSWSNTRLPENKIDVLSSLNVDHSTGLLYATGSDASSGVSRGVLLHYQGGFIWRSIATPNDSQSITSIAFSPTAGYMYIGGQDLNNTAAVWYGNGSWWVNTGLNDMGSITSMAFIGSSLYVAGRDSAGLGAVWALTTAPPL